MVSAKRVDVIIPRSVPSLIMSGIIGAKLLRYVIHRFTYRPSVVINGMDVIINLSEQLLHELQEQIFFIRIGNQPFQCGIGITQGNNRSFSILQRE